MTDDERTRRPVDPRQVVGACLHVATSNTELLSLFASDRDVLASGLNPLFHSIRMTVAQALQQAARHVDAYADTTARNFGERLVAEQELAKAEAVRAIGRKLDVLAERSNHQIITFAEFEDIRAKLMDLGFALKPHHALDVASAVAHRQSP